MRASRTSFTTKSRNRTGASLLVTNRKRTWLTGLLCLMGHIRWWCRRAFRPRAKPPHLTRAPSAPLRPIVARNAELHPLHLARSLMLRPRVPPDPLLRPLVDLLLLHTRRRRIAFRAQRHAQKLADLLWTPSFLPSSSSSSVTTPGDLQATAEETLRWASSTCQRRVNLSPRCSSWSFRTTKPKVSMASSDRVTAALLLLRPEVNWGSLSERGWTLRPCDQPVFTFNLPINKWRDVSMISYNSNMFTLITDYILNISNILQLKSGLHFG